jgi:hypothetical protein
LWSKFSSGTAWAHTKTQIFPNPLLFGDFLEPDFLLKKNLH